MPVAKGDFILIDFTAKVKETGEVFDTSLEETAKQTNLYKPGQTYESMLVAVGEGWVLKGLDEQLAGLEVGKSVSLEIPHEKAFGPRDPNKVRLVPLKRFSGQKVNPVPGLEVEIDGKIGVIRSVGAGRVQVDLNPPLAGRTLIYDLEVKRVIDSREEKIRALVHRRIPNIKTENMQLSVTEKQVTVHIPEEAFFLSGLQLAKKGIAVDLEKFFPELETVEFIERHVKKAEAAKPAEAEPPPSQAESST